MTAAKRCDKCGKLISMHKWRQHKIKCDKGKQEKITPVFDKRERW